MGENNKFVIGAAVAGVLIGIIGLVFGVVSKNRTDQLRSEFLQVQELFDKIARLEADSSGASASVVRLSREVEALRAGTQNVLDRVNSEMVRLSRDLSSGIEEVRQVEAKIAGLGEAGRRALEIPARIIAQGATPAAAAEAAEAGDGAAYTIRTGDTLVRIAREHGVTLDALQGANPNINPLRLQVGQRLVIPEQ